MVSQTPVCDLGTHCTQFCTHSIAMLIKKMIKLGLQHYNTHSSGSEIEAYEQAWNIVSPWPRSHSFSGHSKLKWHWEKGHDQFFTPTTIVHPQGHVIKIWILGNLARIYDGCGVPFCDLLTSNVKEGARFERVANLRVAVTPSCLRKVVKWGQSSFLMGLALQRKIWGLGCSCKSSTVCIGVTKHKLFRNEGCPYHIVLACLIGKNEGFPWSNQEKRTVKLAPCVILVLVLISSNRKYLGITSKPQQMDKNNAVGPVAPNGCPRCPSEAD